MRSTSQIPPPPNCARVGRECNCRPRVTGCLCYLSGKGNASDERAGKIQKGYNITIAKQAEKEGLVVCETVHQIYCSVR